MKINLQLMKLIIRLLILLILFVMLFIISAFLYSAKFWPDVYNYINANITIKRIPTISELNPVFVDEVDFTTEVYSTTDNNDYIDTFTADDNIGLSFDDFLNDAESKRRKRQIPVEEMKISFEVKKAINDDTFDFEVSTRGFAGDLVDVDKLTTTNSKDVQIIFKPENCVKSDDSDDINDDGEVKNTNINVNETNGIYSVFPWIATVFIKNSENNQFDYICDGAVLSNKIVLTAARCIMKENVAVDVESILVILGKRSLQENGPNERVLRVKTVKVHENFTSDEGKVDNDLAIIVLDEPITFNDDIQPVPLQNITGFEAIQTATTGWHVTGQLTPIYFSKESSATCKKNTEALNTFCAVFGDDIITCPSYGGLFVAKENDVEWRFQGLTTGSPTNRGACFNKNVTFTKIASHYKWIMDNIELNKN